MSERSRGVQLVLLTLFWCFFSVCLNTCQLKKKKEKHNLKVENYVFFRGCIVEQLSQGAASQL